MTFDEILQSIANHKFAPVYLLQGEEPFFIDQISSRIEESVMDEPDRDFNQVILYGKDTSVSDIIDNAKQYPFGVPYRLVVVREAQGLTKNKQMEALAQYAENPTESTILVLCHKYGKLDAKKAGGSSKGAVNYEKAFQKHGVVFNSEKIKDYNLNSWIANYVQKNNFSIDSQSVAILAEQIGNDLSRIHSELQKLKILLPEKSNITTEIIEKYVGISKEYNIFELQDALGNRDIAKAYKIVYNFCQYQKENPNTATIAKLFSYYSKFLAYQLSPDKTSAVSAEIFGKGLPPFVLQQKVSVASRFTVPELTKIISILREFDVKAKGVDKACSDEDLLKEMIFKILHPFA